MCSCECCIYPKKIHSLVLSWWEYSLKKTKNQCCKGQNRRSGETGNRLFYSSKIMSCHIVSIYSKQHMILLWQSVYISIVKLCITTLKICFVLLCRTFKYLYSKSRIRSAQFHCQSKNTFLCVKPNLIQ